jgi:hypothetical protein
MSAYANCATLSSPSMTRCRGDRSGRPNLAMVPLAAGAELCLGMPVPAINAATYW